MTDDRQSRAQSQKQTRADRMRKYDPTDAATDRQLEESQVSTDPRIVTPEEARNYIGPDARWPIPDDFAHTVATEPDRTRAAVVKALRNIASMAAIHNAETRASLSRSADAIESGADL